MRKQVAAGAVLALAWGCSSSDTGPLAQDGGSGDATTSVDASSPVEDASVDGGVADSGTSFTPAAFVGTWSCQQAPDSGVSNPNSTTVYALLDGGTTLTLSAPLPFGGTPICVLEFGPAAGAAGALGGTPILCLNDAGEGMVIPGQLGPAGGPPTYATLSQTLNSGSIALLDDAGTFALYLAGTVVTNVPSTLPLVIDDVCARQ